MLVSEDKTAINKKLKEVLQEEGASEDSSDLTIHTISQDSDPLELPVPAKTERHFELKTLLIYERVTSLSDNDRRILRRR